MKGSRLLSLVAVLAASSLARAADLPVTYTVEEKPLKAAIAGTSLSFELYSDNTCTTLVQSVAVDVANVSLLTKLKQLTPKGDAKLPSVAELRTTLPSVASSTAYYLKVIGLGVTPIAVACQAQSLASAPPLPPSHVAIYDSAAQKIGVWDQSSQSAVRDIGGGTVLYLPISPATRTFMQDSLQFLFVSNDCSGPPLMYQNPSFVLGASYRASNGTMYYPPPSAPDVTMHSGLNIHPGITGPASCGSDTFVPPDGCCFPLGGAGIVQPRAPALTFDVSAFLPPFSAILE